MTAIGWLQIAAYLATALALAIPLGAYLARVYQGEPTRVARLLRPVERALYRAGGVREDDEMTWPAYALALLAFHVVGFLAVYLLQRAQALLPLDPQGLPAVAPDLAFNTATSFVTNTNWQAYSGESTLGYLAQMLGLGVQNFLSAAAGMAVLVALVRGFSRKQADTVGSFWVDLVRSTLYVLLPLSLLVAILLVAGGVVQTFAAYPTGALLEPTLAADGRRVVEQVLAVGPAASQVAIKQLGTNGGGFFGVNSAHPFENPTPFTWLVESIALLLVPAALCETFGRMVGDRRQGRALLAAMLAILVPLLVACVVAEQRGNPAFDALGIDQAAGALQPGGNMEGKEARFGVVGSAIWAAATTATSNGSVSAMHDSFTPLGGLVPMWLMQLGEIVFGGVGSGLYGMLVFAVIAVFVAGLMVGRTPEYLGKKIEAFEMKMAALVVLVPAALVLVGSAVTVVVPQGLAGITNPGPHGLSQVLYAFSSAGNNNGSAFAGYAANSPYANTALGVAMFAARFWVVVPVLAMAGSLARKRRLPASAGTLPTHGPLFVVLLVGVVVIVGALTYVPALALGPIAEHVQMLEAREARP